MDTLVKHSDADTLAKSADDTPAKRVPAKVGVTVTDSKTTDVSDTRMVIYTRERSKLVTAFLQFINGVIGSRTALNYHIRPVINDRITIPIHPYTADEARIGIVELLDRRVTELRNFFRNFDWKCASRIHMWLVRSMYKVKIDITKALILSVESSNAMINDIIINGSTRKVYRLHIKPPNIQHAKIRQIRAADGSTIQLYVDPYLDDYGVYIDASVSFGDMGMSYNALHLYEHVLTKMWKSLDNHDVIELNGVTYPTGICNVYTIHSSLNSLRKYVNAAITWLVKSRGEGFWHTTSMRQDIEMETVRTISETRKERSLSSMGRSDPRAYDFSYDVSIFEHWSNTPFNMLVTVKQDSDWNLTVDKLNSACSLMPLRTVPKPPTLTFKRIPLEVLKSKAILGVCTTKVDPSVIRRHVYTSSVPSKVLYGLDCVYTSDDDDISEHNTILFPLLYLARASTEDELNEYIRKQLIPATNTLLCSSLTYSYIDAVLLELAAG